MIDHQSKSIVLGTDGFSAWREDNEHREHSTSEGGFLSIEWSKEIVKIKHDCFGLYPVFYYADHSICIISDSLFVITRAMKMIGLDVALNRESTLTRSWTHGLACSLMTKETLVKGVMYLQPCSHLTIKTDGESIQMKEEYEDLTKIFHHSGKSYIGSLVAAKNEITSVVNSLQKNTLFRYRLGLSGGLDSRIILALILQNEGALKNTYINSNTHESRALDFNVVKSLSREFKFEFNNKIEHSENRAIRVTNPFANYIKFSLGTFDMTYLYRSYWETPYLIEIGGHGAEIAKGTFSNFKLIRKISIWKPIKKFKMYVEVRKALRYHGIKMNQKNSIQWHHFLYKSAIQNGRYLERTQISLRPLMNKKLVSIGLQNQNGRRVLKDLLILLSPKLAARPFDIAEKNIQQSYIDSVLNDAHAIETNENTEYDVIGSPDSIKNGLLTSFDSLTEAYTLDYENKKQSLLQLMERIWHGIQDNDLKKIYLDAYELAQKRLNDDASYFPSAGAPASKIIALGILFD
jgi:hypothetical protein